MGGARPRLHQGRIPDRLIVGAAMERHVVGARSRRLKRGRTEAALQCLYYSAEEMTSNGF
jgi:hypothetical protein